ncbi:MAG: sigma-70 family RNA polymerase sigma factor [Lachnospiraceae bacterium]|nr:sigma-70 family RNA polymerase sigma factor [Lachnospiraceae bacterium]
MSYSEQFKEHIEYTFNGFCKTVLYHEALNAYRDLQRKQRHEISLEYIVAETSFEPFEADEYFQVAYKPTVFQVQGQTVIIGNERLATALSKLSEQRQEIVLLYYFCDYRDKVIGKLYGYCRSTTNYQRQAALKQLRKELEDEE